MQQSADVRTLSKQAAADEGHAHKPCTMLTSSAASQLLGELLFDRSNFVTMKRYISEPVNLKLIMQLLKVRCSVLVASDGVGFRTRALKYHQRHSMYSKYSSPTPRR